MNITLLDKPYMQYTIVDHVILAFTWACVIAICYGIVWTVHEIKKSKYREGGKDD